MRINGEKLALLIPRLASEFDGEIVATVRAIQRILSTTGHDWHDLARIVSGGEKSTPEPSQAHDDDRPAGIIAIAEQLLEALWLSSWERNFLQSICDQARSRYGFRLSNKQKATLDGLIKKQCEMMGRT
jgi:hypothetical protein